MTGIFVDNSNNVMSLWYRIDRLRVFIRLGAVGEPLIWPAAESGYITDDDDAIISWYGPGERYATATQAVSASISEAPSDAH